MCNKNDVEQTITQIMQHPARYDTGEENLDCEMAVGEKKKKPDTKETCTCLSKDML